MADSDPLLQKADALMQRQRAAAAGGDDVPVLTDVVPGERPVAAGRAGAAVRTPQAAPPQAAPAPAAPAQPTAAQVDALVRERMDQLLPLLRRQIARELDAWFDEQLPRIITGLLDGLADRLVGQISTQARGDLMTWLQTAGEDLDVGSGKE